MILKYLFQVLIPCLFYGSENVLPSALSSIQHGYYVTPNFIMLPEWYWSL